jgi:zinc transport system substrate-binding protein
MRFAVPFLSCIMVLLMAACQQESRHVPHDDDAITVVASNFPTYYMTKRLAPENVSVTYPVPGDVDPAFWEPTPEDIQAMQEADLVVLNGATYEKWRVWVSLPDARVVETAASFQEQWIMSGDATVHSHGPAGEHSHGEVDFNTWLDPRLAARQAEAIADALKQVVPADAEAVDRELVALKADFDEIDTLFASVAQQIGDAPLIASHPVYNYFARRHDLNLQSVHWEPEAAPSKEDWLSFDHLAKEHPAKVMLWEDDPLDETSAHLAERGIVPVVFATAGNASREDDLIQIMRENAERLKSAF